MNLPDPYFLYGTAWKEDETARLTTEALDAGYRGIDTANQRKHYFEAAVGDAIGQAIRRGQVKREDLFLQTKFTYQGGQDHRLPYDPSAPVVDQVRQSFDNSLGHLQVDYIDSYVLHGPSRRPGLGPADWAVWRTMENLFSEGRIGALGISNVMLDQLEALAGGADILPSFVQNRCYAKRGWDRPIRQFCIAHGIRYQGFSLLTANRPVLGSEVVADIAERLDRTPAQVIFRFSHQAGMLPITGTSRRNHMEEDLQIFEFTLTENDVAAIEQAGEKAGT